MSTPKPRRPDTRTRLLTTASRMFAEKGFQETTIADICKQAEANIASVNYHFRDKENLYLQAWRFAFQLDLAAHPVDGGVPCDAPANQRLAGRIRSLMGRIDDDNSHFFAIINKEMAQPTQLLPEILVKEINPQRQAMMAIIKELLGSAASEQNVQYSHASIIGQCFHFARMKHMLANSQLPFELPDELDATAYTEHVIRFSLAGIAALRQPMSGNGEI
ncbi:TetR family transcriptional regulator [Methylomonas lenta]|uniref:TetR family transcriptional regulator n=1 Tax=Methylomonas lenta TaxID=980561 RepID=A0A177N7K9_9GAMM|nr:CerR family C-terminal domain-containing protein [Methylomonas lenta]MDD2738715.1 CerR family C-terminal domain-containing protein [Methylomonas lenta]OAI14016.1 TetR family transcriptional regulator [Methylomonas lenta]